MIEYKLPLRDIEFVARELFDFPRHYGNLTKSEPMDWELMSSVLDEFAKFATSEIAPLNRVGDNEGCTWDNGTVTTPTGFKAAYEKFVEAGWPSTSQSQEYGGQGLPKSMWEMMGEITCSTNFAWQSYGSLSTGAMKTLESHGTEDQKDTYLPKLISGAWTGTMCLTEPHCGTDLGMLRTRAAPKADGTYAITGTKIFISCGEHDMAENIIHIVLARIEGAPGGTKGISLFIVPKCKVGADGNVDERNAVNCGSVEHKMGIHGSATCVMNFDDATGYLVGQPNKGLAAMFTFMNAARLSAATQGLGHMEFGFQQSLAYARERLQGRSPTGAKNPDGPADAIIEHPDVRRMLLTQKALAEGSRMLILYCAKLVDVVEEGAEDNERKNADGMLGFLTPIAKAFNTEAGFESANLAVQCFGGHGYISEWGVEQNVRDSRISTLYEGTTGVQALDLIGRKVLGNNGQTLAQFIDIVEAFCCERDTDHRMAEFTTPLRRCVKDWLKLTQEIGQKATSNPNELGAASVDYLMYSGYIVHAFMWALAVAKAFDIIDEDGKGDDFYQTKIFTARFFYQRLLPRAEIHAKTARSGSVNLMELKASLFSFA